MKVFRETFRQRTTLLLSIALAAATCPADAQQAPTPTPTPAPANGTSAPKAVLGGDQPANPDQQQAVVLSPFEVDATKDQGYYTANTLAGTRLNNNIADLPSSISVVTKQELEDTNSQNINDVFRYEANTEGARTYTPTNVAPRGNVADSLGGSGGTTGTYTSALDTGFRVRGLAAPDNEEDNFYSLYRIPFDSYNTEAVEIERGPNSIIFGTGSPAGIVNQDRIQADVNKLSGETTFQASSWGGLRESFGLNIPIIRDRLAIYVAQVYDAEGFEQKPSSDITRREYAAFTLYPFKNHKTKINGSVEYYNNYANDPNDQTPIDNVTPWLNSGRPVWNPINDTVSYLDTGKNVGPYTISSTYPNYAGILQTMLTASTSPYFVPSLTFESATHNVMFIDQGSLENFFRGSQTSLDIPGWVPTKFTSAQALVNEERMTVSTNLPTPALNSTTSLYAAYALPAVVSKDIYNWSDINIDSVDNTDTKATTYNLSFQQSLLSDLTFQVSFFRQELTQLIDSPEDQASAAALAVDTNQYLPNGTPNLHLGQPFIDVYQADVYSEPEINTNWRAMLDYEPDLRDKVPGWLKWIGHHRFLGVYSQHDDVQTNLRYRPSIDGGDPNYLPTAATLNAAAGYAYTTNSAIEQWFYLAPPGAPPNGVGVTSPGIYNRPGYGGPTVAPIQTYNYATGQWAYTNIHMDSLLFETGGLSENLQDSKTFFWQSFFWNDRIIGSLGINDDEVKNRNTIFPATNPNAILYPSSNANLPVSSYWYDEGPWTIIGGNTSTEGVVVHPFKDWSMIDRQASNGNILAGALRTLSFTFNKSDNFNPPPAYYTDFFGNPLGKPEGQEKDYGVEIATPDNKFFLRATWFNTTNQNAITTFTSTARAEYVDVELQHWAQEVVEVRNGENPTSPNFNNVAITPISLAEEAQISALTGLPYNFGGNVGGSGEYVAPNGTENGAAKGVEVEATYNPIPNWTMKLTWGKQQTTVTGAASQAQAWVTYRLPKWQAYTAPDQTQVYTLSGGGPLYLGNFWQAYGYDGTITGPGNINGWTTTQNYYNSVVAAQLASDEANNGSLAPNQREYSWSYLTNYTVERGPLKHIGIGGALTYDGEATAGYYGNPAVRNSSDQITAPNINAPIYTPGRYHIDAWVGYQFKMPWDDKIVCKVQFNVADLTSNGYLVPISYNLDGTAAAERIIPPRSYSLSAKFSF